MKKIISMVLTAVMLLTVTSFAADPASLTVNIGAIINGTIEVSVSLAGASAINYAEVELGYDPLKLGVGALTKGEALGATAALSANNGKISYKWEAAENKAADGVLFTGVMNVIGGDFSETDLTITASSIKSKGNIPLTHTKVPAKLVLPEITFEFANNTVQYNSAVQRIFATGYPAGSTVAYTNNDNIDVGTHEITVTVSKAGFKTVTKKANLTIEKTKITVTVDPDQKKRLGDEEPALTYKFQGESKVGELFTGSLVREAGEEVGTYRINQGSLALDSNYEIEFVGDSFRIIEKEPQNIEIAEIPAKSYGDEPFRLEVSSNKRSSLPILIYASSNSDIASVDSEGNVTIKGTGDVEFTVTEPGNEVFGDSVAKKSIRISKRILHVKADDVVAVYGDDVKTSFSYDGFVEGENQNILIKPATVSTFTIPKSGTYDIVVDGAEADNYVFDYTNGKLFVSKKDITIKDIKVFSKAMDGTTAATINNSSLELEGRINNDSVTVDIAKATAEFAYADVGDNIEVNITGLELAGRDSESYKLTNTAFKTRANIKEELSAEINAKQINVSPIEKDATDLTIPTVPQNYSIEIESSSSTAVISKNGKIFPVWTAAEVDVVFVVRNMNNADDFAYTDTIPYTVPASTPVKIDAEGELYGKLIGGGTFLMNEEVTLTAVPDAGYRFYCIRDEKGNAHGSTVLTFTATEDKSFKAEFTKAGGSLVPVSQVVANVTTNVPSGTVTTGTKITLSTLTQGATIYYTKDGTTPTSSSLIYNDEIIVDKNMTIKAVATKSQHSDSSVTTRTYAIRKGKTELKSNASSIKYMTVKNNKFRPDVAATRYEVVDALSQLFDIQKISNSKLLSDIDPEFKDIVDLFVGAGVIDGYPDGTFGGNRGITRAEFVKIASVLLNLTETSGSVRFDDVNGHWAEGYIKLFADRGYINGYPDGTFQPDSNVSRAEIVTIINRIAKTKKTNMNERFEDLFSWHWAFIDIMNVVK